jgi:amino acid transporter
MNTTVQVEPVERSTNDGTYYDSKRLLRICSACEILSWFALLLGSFSLVVWVWYLFSSLTTAHYPSLSAFLGNAAPLVIVLGMAALICFFFWAFLRAISEGLYLLMDIQEGQKRDAAA